MLTAAYHENSDYDLVHQDILHFLHGCRSVRVPGQQFTYLFEEVVLVSYCNVHLALLSGHVVVGKEGFVFHETLVGAN